MPLRLRRFGRAAARRAAGDQGNAAAGNAEEQQDGKRAAEQEATATAAARAGHAVGIDVFLILATLAVAGAARACIDGSAAGTNVTRSGRKRSSDQ